MGSCGFSPNEYEKGEEEEKKRGRKGGRSRKEQTEVGGRRVE